MALKHMQNFTVFMINFFDNFYVLFNTFGLNISWHCTHFGVYLRINWDQIFLYQSKMPNLTPIWLPINRLHGPHIKCIIRILLPEYQNNLHLNKYTHKIYTEKITKINIQVLWQLMQWVITTLKSINWPWNPSTDPKIPPTGLLWPSKFC